MRTVVEARACAIIRNLLTTIGAPRGVFLLPANVCPVVPLTLLTVGHPFEFVDIDASSLCMDPALVNRRLRSHQPRVTGIVFVRTYGAVADASACFAAWKRVEPECLLIDDRCLSVPEPGAVDMQGADVVLFSTGRGKFVDLDYGGFAHISDQVTYQPQQHPYDSDHFARMTRLYQHHIEIDTPIVRSMTDMPHWIAAADSAIPANDYLERVSANIGTITSHKQGINDVYRQRLPTSIQVDNHFHDWRFQIRVPGKRALLEQIFGAGAFASGHYYPASRLFGQARCEEAERLYSNVINLFNDFNASVEQACDIAAIVNRHVDESEHDQGER